MPSCLSPFGDVAPATGTATATDNATDTPLAEDVTDCWRSVLRKKHRFCSATSGGGVDTSSSEVARRSSICRPAPMLRYLRADKKTRGAPFETVMVHAKAFRSMNGCLVRAGLLSRTKGVRGCCGGKNTVSLPSRADETSESTDNFAPTSINLCLVRTSRDKKQQRQKKTSRRQRGRLVHARLH